MDDEAQEPMSEESMDDELNGEVHEAEPLEGEGEEIGGVRWLRVGLVLGLLVAAVVVALLTTDAGSAVAYSTEVHLVADDPAAFAERELRVEGGLKEGSIEFREDPCEWRFVLESEGRELPVRFPQCVVPDTFRDGFGITVTVQGRVEDERFLANQVIPRCPSKYEMQERMEAGEAMPHEAPGAG